MSYKVNDTILILRGRSVPEGTPLTDADLEGIDVERLLRLGSIVEASDAEEQAAEDGGEGAAEPIMDLNALTKAELVELAKPLEIEGFAKLSKGDMISAIRAAWDTKVEEASELGEPSEGE